MIRVEELQFLDGFVGKTSRGGDETTDKYGRSVRSERGTERRI